MISILAVDVGNSRIKWGVNEDHHWLIKKQIVHSEIELLPRQWKNFKNINLVVVSTVSNQLITNTLNTILSSLNYDAHWVISRSYQCGITNNYKYHQHLGSDRWAAMIGAWNKFHESCVVVNVGTAMTVDAITRDGLFLGGYIVPGPFLQSQCLATHTQINYEKTLSNNHEIFPVTTTSAVHNGISVSLSSLIEKTLHLFSKHEGYYPNKCILSGGGFDFIRNHIDFPVHEIDNLVLEGLVVIAHDLLQPELS